MSLPEKFGRYQVLDLLGQGAMGLVYRAVDPVIERGVAVKVIQATPGIAEADLERMRARFEQEFRSAGALSHANIVTVFDVGQEGDLYYIAMEYVEGRGLDRVLADRGVLGFSEVAELARELASALDYAHAQGVVHRDIKPANVLLDVEGRAKITDFGLAKLEATTLTRTGALVGTPAYMSPEQVAGQAITGKTDQFSLAILLYQALTGERPFTGDNPSTIMYRIAHEEPLPARQLNKSLPDAVDHVLLRALQKDVAERFPSCTEMADGLRQALGGAPLETLATPAAAGPPVEAATIPEGAPAATAPIATSPIATAPAATAPASSAADAAAPPATVSIVQEATPRWLLALGIVLPSIALLAMVAWFVFVGMSGDVPRRDPGSEQSPAGAAPEETLSTPAGSPGAAGTETDSDEQPSGEGTGNSTNAEPGAATGEPAEAQAVSPPAPADAETRAGRSGRAGDRVEPLVGIPPQIQALIASGEVRSGRLVVDSPIPVALRIVPANRFQALSQQLRERLQNATAEERRRLMAGFLIAQDTSHDLQLPAGNWRVVMLSPQVFFYHEEQVALRPGRTFNLGERVPSQLARVRITSEPAGARVRVGNLPAVATPFDGLVVVGDHRFEFIWGDVRTFVPQTIDRDGQQVVGRRQQRRP